MLTQLSTAFSNAVASRSADIYMYMITRSFFLSVCPSPSVQTRFIKEERQRPCYFRVVGFETRIELSCMVRDV